MNSDARRARFRRDGLSVAALLAFLLLYLSPFMLRNATLFKIGNDFQILYANYATYFVDAVRSGFVPLWNPNEGCGYPYLSNPFTASLYPGRLLYFIFAAGSPQYSWYHHQLYMVAGVCLLALGVYAWLRGRGVGPSAAVVAAGVVAIGLRIADIYRFPNAIHAAAWMPWILYAYDRWIDRSIARGFLLGIFALFCLGTAGYPYYTVYAVPLIASYVVLRMVEGVPRLRALTAIASLVIPAGFLLLPYYRGMARTLAATVDRSGVNYQYSTLHPWSYLDLLGGLVFPPSASSEGWLYCGLVPVLIVLVWASVRKTTPAALIWIAGLTFAVQLIAAGTRSFAFPALWTFVPGIQSLRIFPRMTIILLWPLALLIALGYEGITSSHVPDRVIRRSIWRIALVVGALQVLLWTTKMYSHYFAVYFEKFMQPNMFVMMTLVAAVYVTVWASHVGKAKLGWALAALLVTGSDTGMYGLQIWRESVGVSVPTGSLNLPRYYRNYFTTPRYPSAGMAMPYMPTSGPLLNWYYGTYVTFFERYSGKPGFAEFTGLRGRKIFFSPSLGAPPEKFAQWWRGVGAFEAAAGASATPIGPRYNGNELHLSYRTSRPGYLIFVDNHDRYWHARLNGKPVPIKLAFGTFKAVAVPAGKGTVMFKYSPFPSYKRFMLLGVLIVIGIVAFEIRRRRRTQVDHDEALTPITTSS